MVGMTNLYHSHGSMYGTEDKISSDQTTVAHLESFNGFLYFLLCFYSLFLFWTFSGTADFRMLIPYVSVKCNVTQGNSPKLYPFGKSFTSHIMKMQDTLSKVANDCSVP